MTEIEMINLEIEERGMVDGNTAGHDIFITLSPEPVLKRCPNRHCLTVLPINDKHCDRCGSQW